MKKAISLFLALVMCLSLCACQEKVAPERIEAYNNANACFSQERYEDAAKFYIEAGDYEDSQQKLLEIYYYAVTCFEHERYDEAFSLFDLLSGSVEFTNSSVYDKAIVNARTVIDSSKDRTNPSIVYKFLDVAMAHSNEQQKWEVQEYKKLLSQKLYEGTLFWKPSISGGDSVTEETLEGEYTHYHYNFKSGADAEKFKTTYNDWYNDYEREWYQPVPDWLEEITGMDYADEVFYDDLGNILACDFSLSYNSKGKFIGGTADVHIIYANYVKSVKN